MSVYNVERYLKECLDSVFNQSFENFELIIINDGSNDNSVKIIQEYRNKHNNIVYIEQQNQGLSVARNLGLSIAKGKYVAYVDSDDCLDKDMFKLMVQKIEYDNSDMVIIGHREFYDDMTGQDTDILLKVDDTKTYSGIDVANMMLDCEIMGVAWNKLYKREKLLADQFMFEKGRYTQDWFPVFQHISKLEKISFVNKPLYQYRLNPNSTTSLKNYKRFKDYYYAVSCILEYVKDSKLNFNKKSICHFEINTFSQIILMYYSLNEWKGNLYKNFKKENNYQIDISIIKIFLAKDYRKSLYILSWKLHLFKEVMILEGFIKKYVLNK